jgi:anaerobic magnesium-protoporphyrin IX monomethyl ester cyclase
LRVLLVQPSLADFYITSQRLQPTGLLYLASFLNSHGHQADILDCLSPLSETAMEPDPGLGYVKEFFIPDLMPTGIFNVYKHFGLSGNDLKEKISGPAYDAYGISCNFCAYYKQAMDAARIIRESHPGAVIVCGGNAVPVLYEKFLESGTFDIAVFGEGETPLLGLLDNGLDPETVPNIAYKKNGTIHRNPVRKDFDVNSTCLDLDCVDPENYKIGKHRSLSLASSRGCPYSCTYCTANLNCLNGYKRMDLEKFCHMADENIRRHDIGALNIEDENFTYDKAYAAGFLEWKIAHHPELRLYFMNGLAWQDLDTGLLQLLKQADLLNLNLSLVERDSGHLGRKTDETRFLEIVNTGKDIGLAVTVYIISGIPGQKKKDVFETIEWLHSLGVVIGYSVYYPVPGTPLFEAHPRFFEGLDPVQMRSTALFPDQADLSRKDLVDLFRYVRLLNASMEMKGDPGIPGDGFMKDLSLTSSRKISSSDLTRLGIGFFRKSGKFLILRRICSRKGKFEYQFETRGQNII